MAGSVKLKADQVVRRYVGIDVTKALDTVAFGHMWNAFFGWRNLVWDLNKDPANDQVRVDSAHAKMPIKRLVRTHSGTDYADTVVMPENVDGSGSDSTYTDVDIKAADKFMHTFILRPSVDSSSSSLNDAGTGVVADLIYISSHGLHDGVMFGTGMAGEWLFELAVAASGGGQFAGPGWVVLSNCGTLDDQTHEDWMKVMSGSTPLRGIVGFRETCPLEGGSVDFAAVFIHQLATGATMLNAWKTAVSTKVSSTAWIVLCHEEAKDDTIADWNASKLKAIASGSKILRFDSTTPATGTQVVATPDPYEAFWSKGGTRITAINMFDPANQMGKGDAVTITVKPTAPATTFTAGTTITVTIVYIRVDYPQIVDISKMFSVTGQTGANAPTTSRTNMKNANSSEPDTWTLTVTGTPSEVTLTLQCLDFSMLKELGVPLRLQVNNGSSTFLFVRNGSAMVH
ncbi:MAG: hypothetical protein JO103_14750 [Candidatus Eremiobacteraeota bacterium]|nr:hypothetical protein [Candidatus Eremiobacteraeota bacterium]MBV9409861.1 hypothetical protein [Candidatus Eremiobacteraeota bacterium]